MQLHKTVLSLALLLISMIANAGQPTVIKPFNANSMQSILDARQGKPFIIGLWSLSCTHCRDDLFLLAKLSQQHPGLDLVLIASDTIEQSDDARGILQQYSFNHSEHWIFADDFTEKLRYSIDRRWQGELPRTIFYDSTHQMQAISGKLKPETVKQWLQSQKIP